MKIGITGATGQLGQHVIQFLLHSQAPENIVALVHNQDKALHLTQQRINVRYFNYDEPASLAPALQGIDKLLLISANEVGRRTPQHQAVIEAAQKAKVKHIVYTSLFNAEYSPLALAQEHRETEALLKESGIAYTLLRNNWYSENYLATLPQIITQGVLYGAAGEGKISSASRQDYAEAAAKVLISSGHEQKVYELAGSSSFTLSKLAEIITQISGKTVRYQNLTAQEYTEALLAADLPEGLVNVIVDADIQAAQGAMYSESKDLELLIGHASTDIKSQIKQLMTS
ncbi:SDR family oxidoreductase [Acinetobacter sp. ANC 3791]|uniref:SDR family oxidoreductase n=1 Tax=Acinetobacter sp. ANC 3791 TaxID=2529836 RepID=UPI00103E89E9|nr:SDR family oxidoreductase [Acinetobacter sp. ANC 3791]TCB83431.1 SDR family oxidoreductase [Acinetobacter sp. ANC 3791]